MIFNHIPLTTYCESSVTCESRLYYFNHGFEFSNFSYNIQILHLLKSPQDAWTKVMRKVANDAVYRIFYSFPKAEKDKLTKDIFIKCFLRGKSAVRKIKGVTHRGETHLGREIKVENEGTV